MAIEVNNIYSLLSTMHVMPKTQESRSVVVKSIIGSRIVELHSIFRCADSIRWLSENDKDNWVKKIKHIKFSA